jgi:hypothetical protein
LRIQVTCRPHFYQRDQVSVLKDDALNLVERKFISPPIVELCRAR